MKHAELFNINSILKGTGSYSIPNQNDLTELLQELCRIAETVQPSNSPYTRKFMTVTHCEEHNQ